MKKRNIKMNCRDCIERIDEYTEGKLAYDEKLSFDAHLQTCPECMEFIRLQELADRIIKEEKKIVPDFYLTGKIMAGIESLEKEVDPLLTRILRPALLTISLAAAIMGGVLIGKISGGMADTRVPIELTLMNDAEMELVNVLAADQI
jgi:anti-sigma factor RsiW